MATRKSVGLAFGWLLSAAFIALSTTLVQRADAAAAQENPTAIRELAERLLDQRYPGDDSATRTVELLPGQLASNLPLNLSLSMPSRVVGSVQTIRNGEPASIQAVIDVTGELWDVHRAYGAALGAQGWNPPAQGMSMGAGGFQQSPALGNFFCRGEEAPYLTMSLRPRDSGTVEARFMLSLSAPSSSTRAFTPCSPQPGPPYGAAYRKELLPPLSPPAGARLRSTGQSGGSASWGSDAVIEVNMEPTALQAYFADQLATAGWTRRASGVDPAFAWSTWDIAGEGDWNGLLTVQRLPAEGKQAVSLRAVSSNVDAAGPYPGYMMYPY